VESETHMGDAQFMTCTLIYRSFLFVCECVDASEDAAASVLSSVSWSHNDDKTVFIVSVFVTLVVVNYEESCKTVCDSLRLTRWPLR